MGTNQFLSGTHMLIAKVKGCKRVPDPPAKIIPFIFIFVLLLVHLIQHPPLHQKYPTKVPEKLHS